MPLIDRNTRIFVLRSFAILVGLALLTPVGSFSQEKKTELRVASKQWTGVFANKKLKDVAKPWQIITDAETLAKVWKPWKGKDALPEVDFKTQFVVVCTSDYELDTMSIYGGPDKWNTSASNKSPKQLGGFSWAVGVFDTKGIKELNGMKFEEYTKEKPKDK